MKTFYLVATIVGYAAANALVAVESVKRGNILLWTKPLEAMRVRRLPPNESWTP